MYDTVPGTGEPEWSKDGMSEEPEINKKLTAGTSLGRQGGAAACTDREIL